MQIATIPFERLEPGNEIARAYLVEPETVLPRFAFDYREPRGLRALAERQRSRVRPAWGRVLAAYNREIGGSVANAERLDSSLCVVSGQQAGLLLGPAYTTYKLFTLIRLAEALSEEMGEAVLPVFWIESEDHDWDEVNRFFWKGRRFRMQGEVEPGTPVGRVEMAPEPFLREVREVLGEAGEAWRLVAPDRRVARWHARNLARLVEGTGVVFVEPSLLREPMRPLAERIGRAADGIDRALSVRDGLPLPLQPPEGGYLFDASGPRRRVGRGEPLPQVWSTDVVSRVLVQNAALPVIAAVCGPGEIAYWSQLKEVHALFDLPMPAVVPRNGATLVEAGIARDAARFGLDLEEVVRGVAAPPETQAADPVAGRLRRLAEEAGALARALEEGALDLPPNTERPFGRTVQRLENDLVRLAQRLDDARADVAGVGRRKYERVLEELRPRGRLQERSHSLFPYLLRHGPGLARALLDSFDPYEFGHYLVRL